MPSGLDPIRIKKNWNTNTNSREENWDEIANAVTFHGLQTNNNFKQIGLDIDGANYQFNGVGRSTQTTSIISRLTTLENTAAIVGTRNLGIDISTQSTVTLDGADGTNLSTTNPAVVTFNSTVTAGQLVSRNITANVSLALTGCHWGHDTFGDLTDYILWLLLLDTGTTTIFGIAAQGGIQTVTAANAQTAAGSVTAIGHVYVSAAVPATYNCSYIGWVRADFDDTGNPGGENFWTVQNGVGDVNASPVQSYFEGTVAF